MRGWAGVLTVLWLAVLSGVAPPLPAQPSASTQGPLIAAAADLRFALDELAAAFTRATGNPLRIVYGSSGNFRRQIAEGAPFELFLSADESYVLALRREGHLVDDGTLYAIGRLALVLPQGSPLQPDPTLGDLAKAVADGRLKRFAIANPEHAPYGRAAQEALTRAGVWPAIRGRLVLGENVAQAAQFAVSGSTQGGLVALSLALAPGALGGAAHVEIPATMHGPLRQRMALTRRAGEPARAFYEWLRGAAARAVLTRYGFAAPSPPARRRRSCSSARRPPRTCRQRGGFGGAIALRLRRTGALCRHFGLRRLDVAFERGIGVQRGDRRRPDHLAGFDIARPVDIADNPALSKRTAAGEDHRAALGCDLGQDQRPGPARRRVAGRVRARMREA